MRVRRRSFEHVLDQIGGRECTAAVRMSQRGEFEALRARHLTLRADSVHPDANPGLEVSAPNWQAPCQRNAAVLLTIWTGCDPKRGTKAAPRTVPTRA